jgi:hypothetical protein
VAAFNLKMAIQINHEIHKTHENKRRNGSLHVAEKFTCQVNQQILEMPCSFVCFVTTIRGSEQPVWASILWRAWEANFVV